MLLRQDAFIMLCSWLKLFNLRDLSKFSPKILYSPLLISQIATLVCYISFLFPSVLLLLCFPFHLLYFCSPFLSRASLPSFWYFSCLWNYQTRPPLVPCCFPSGVHCKKQPCCPCFKISLVRLTLPRYFHFMVRKFLPRVTSWRP